MTGRISRRGMLAGLVGGGLVTALARKPAMAAEPRYLVVYWIAGGWDPTFVFDPHFESNTIHHDPASSLSTVSGLAFADAPSRPSVRAFIEKWGAKSAFVNGIAVGSISHDGCTRLMLTAHRTATAADFSTRVAHETGLPHVVLSGPRFPGDRGEVVLPVNATLVTTADGTLPSPRDEGSESRVQAWLQEEAARLPESAAKAQYLDGLSRLPELHENAGKLRGGLSANDDDVFGTVASVLGAGIARAVTLQGSLPTFGNWDSHVGNDALQTMDYEWTFGRLSSLMARLETESAPDGSPLADRTTVLVLSEMGRSPVLNSAQGKDHWPWTSAMLIGAGVRGGKIYGGTDAGLAGQRVDPTGGDVTDGGDLLTPASLAAGLLTSFGIDPAEDYDGVTPFTAPFET